MRIIKLIFRLIFIIFGALLGIKYRGKKRHIYNYNYNNTYQRNYEVYQKPHDNRLDEITSEGCGTQSERDLISALLDYGISPKAIFHDLILKNGKEKSTQIDIVVATKVGLIVFEVKDYSGWIFGKGKQNKWVQVLSYGYRYRRSKKYPFYNPVLQNESHIKALQRQSKQFKNLPFYSVIIFAGDCELRDVSFIPKGTFVAKDYRLNEVLNTIFENEDAEYTDKREVMRILKSAVENGNNADAQTEHVENIKDMLGKDRVLD